MSELLANKNTYSAKDASRPSMVLNFRRRRIPKLDTNFESYIGVLIRWGDVYCITAATLASAKISAVRQS